MTRSAELTLDEQPPYGYAAVAALVVLLGYVVSLAPSVTFWDAGEFIASAHILGIPHPPGTPLFVLLGHVWDMLIPGLTTAVKTNLMSATFSAGSAGFLFLFVHQALAAGARGMDAETAKLFRLGGAFAATLIGAFTFTNWQNSNETEVYQVAMFSIGLIAWLCWLWRRDRGGKRGSHELLLLIYVLGAALGNHLMALLVGPAVIAFMFHVLRTQPARDPRDRQVQWSEWGVATSLWIAMVGVGVANKYVIILGLALFIVAAVYAFMSRSGFFAIAALLVAVIGVSTYLFLYIRAGLHPFISEADPATLKNLWAVIGREQYPPRGPFDNPIYQHDTQNPGRFVMPFDLSNPLAGGRPSLTLLAFQIINYLQYQDWQFAASLQKGVTLLAPARIPFTLAFMALAVWGAIEHRKWDRSSWWFLFTLWATTGIGLLIYLNFKPGFSIGYEIWPDREMHEVRERDYFYTVSYVMAGIWSGVGLAVLFHRLRGRFGSARPASAIMLAALLPFALNFGAATRRQLSSNTLPRDFAYDMLNSVEPFGILFTNGDNDTFPLWYAQEVENIRQDVVIVNLSLVNTDWYIRQLRDNPARPYRPDSNAVRLYGRDAGPVPACSPAWADTLDAWARAAKRHGPDRSRGMAMCLHTLNDATIDNLQPRLMENGYHFRAGAIAHDYPANTPFYVKDVMTLRLIQENLGRRPIYFAITSGGGARMDLDAYITQRALVYKLYPDSVHMGGNLVQGLFGAGQPPLDVEWTARLAHGTYLYSRLFDARKLELDPTDDNIATNLALPIWSLGYAALQRNDFRSALRELELVAHLMPDNREMQQQIQQVRAVSAMPNLLPDTTQPGRRPDSARATPPRADSSKRR